MLILKFLLYTALWKSKVLYCTCAFILEIKIFWNCITIKCDPHLVYIFCIVSPNSTHIPTWTFKSSPCTFADFSIKTEMGTFHLGCYMWKPHFPPLLHIHLSGATFLICKEKKNQTRLLRKNTIQEALYYFNCSMPAVLSNVQRDKEYHV